MRTLITIAALAFAVFAPTADACASPTHTVADLVVERAELDGQTVTIVGEVVSEALRGGVGHVWLNVLDDGTAVGVWMPTETASGVTTFGNWKEHGDLVTVTGTFNRACDVHGGDLDIHAKTLDVVNPGSARETPVQPWKAAVGMVGIAAAALGWRRLRHAREAVAG